MFIQTLQVIITSLVSQALVNSCYALIFSRWETNEAQLFGIEMSLCELLTIAVFHFKSSVFSLYLPVL